MEGARKQVALRKNASQSGIAAELLMLLETLSADGVIVDDEITGLRTWLNDNQKSDLPAIGFLLTTVEHILADGKVTGEERLALHRAVERVLPKELRETARRARQALELVEKARGRDQKNEASKLRQRNRPIRSLNFMAAGVMYDGRARIIEQYLEPQQTVFLIRERQNPHDANAVKIHVDNERSIGYVPREDAAELAPLLDADHRQIAYCTKILNGRNAPIPVVQATIYSSESTVPGALSAADVTVRMSQASTSAATKDRARHYATGKGCLACLGGIVGLVVLVFLIALLVFR